MTEKQIWERINRELINNYLFDLNEGHHTLIAGLGGTGLKWGTAVKKLLESRYKSEDVNNRAAYLFIDSDSNEFNRYDCIERDERCILDNTAFRSYTADRCPPEAAHWINRDVPVRELINGAGQIRMGGRCYFFENEPVIRSMITQKLTVFQQRQTADRTEQTNIIVLSGLCGGTGSGSFIDIAYMLKKYAAAAGIITPVLFGIFELPDSLIKRIPQAEKDGEIRWRLQNNGYAALKELDYFMKKTQDDGKTPYRFLYRGETAHHEDAGGIFNRVYLLSNDVRTGGGGLLPKSPPPPDKNSPPPFFYLDRAVPELVNALISKPRFTDAESGRAYNSYNTVLSNYAMQRTNINEGTLYSTAGVGKLEVPTDAILWCVIARVFYEFNARWKTEPLPGEIDELYNRANLEASHMEAAAIMDVIIDALDKKDDLAKKNGMELKALAQARLEEGIRSSGSLTDWTPGFEAYMDALYLERGPFYLINLTYAAGKRIEAYCNALSQADAGFQDELDLYQGAFLKNDKKLRFLMKERMAGTKNKAFIDLMASPIKQKVCGYNNDFYNTSAKLIEALSRILNQAARIDSDTARTVRAEGEIFTWNLSKAAIAEVREKTAAMFKKIIISQNTSADTNIPFEDLYELHGTARGKKVFFYDRNQRGGATIDVISESGTSYYQVALIKEVIINGGRPLEAPFDFDKTASDVLEAVFKKRKEAPGAEPDILGILITHIQAMCGAVIGAAFEDLLLRSSQAGDFSKPQGLSNEEKKALFTRALQDFYFYAGPSFPFNDGAVIPARVDLNYTTLSISPKIQDEDFQDIYTNEFTAYNERTAVIERSPLMLNLRHYLQIKLADYYFLPELYKGKQQIQERSAQYVPGTHLAEGSDPAWDWRSFPELNFPGREG
jgi:hypothetical protein